MLTLKFLELKDLLRTRVSPGTNVSPPAPSQHESIKDRQLDRHKFIQAQQSSNSYK